VPVSRSVTLSRCRLHVMPSAERGTYAIGMTLHAIQAVRNEGSIGARLWLPRKAFD